jgi:hypothetical protein
MNTVIPEFIQRLDYEKGSYYANVGNYGSAGAAHLEFYKTLPQDFVTVEGGSFGYAPGVFGVSEKIGPGTVLVGGEAAHDDGPWVHPDASKEPSDRYGIEFTNYYTPIKHLAFDFDVAESTARFTSTDADAAAPGGAGGTRVPEAVGTVISSGITLIDERGFSASLRLRYFGPRDLTSDGIYQSKSTLLLNAEAGYQFTKNWRVFAELLNLLDSRDHDIDYAYQSRITPGSGPIFSDIFHPVEPFQLRVGLTATF